MYQKATFYSNRGTRQQQFPEDDPRVWDLQKAQEIARQAINTHPKSRGAQKAKNLLTSLEATELQIQTEQVWPNEQSALVQISYKNTEEVYFRLIRINDKRAEEIQKAWRRDREKVLNKILGMKTVKQWEQTLKADTDLRLHRTEIAIEPQPFGRYLLLASDQKNFKGGNTGYLFYQVSDLGYFQRASRSPQKELFAVDRNSGDPKEGVTVECWEEVYNSVFSRYESKLRSSQTTNSEGRTDLDILSSNHSYTLLLRNGDDSLQLDDRYNHYYRPNVNRAKQKTNFFLDRAIYRPGQTVYFKAVLLQKDQEGMPTILKNRSVTITFRDANYQEIATQTLRSNSYGTVNGSFIAPEGGLLGQMQLYSDVGGSVQTLR
ncbi:MAG: MG2 domain-containing protein, partial [Bacteroidota bacterium]